MAVAGVHACPDAFILFVMHNANVGILGRQLVADFPGAVRTAIVNNDKLYSPRQFCPAFGEHRV
jgi:hypothetical protein